MASIKVIVSDPWYFITEKTNTNILYGTILLVEDDLEKILVELDHITEYKQIKFRKIVCSARYVGQKFNLHESADQPCAIIGVPEKVFDQNNPFLYNFHLMVNLLGSFEIMG